MRTHSLLRAAYCLQFKQFYLTAVTWILFAFRYCRREAGLGGEFRFRSVSRNDKSGDCFVVVIVKYADGDNLLRRIAGVRKSKLVI